MKQLITICLLAVFTSAPLCAEQAAADPAPKIQAHVEPPQYLMFIGEGDDDLIVYEQMQRRHYEDPTLLTVHDSKLGKVANIWVEVAGETEASYRFKILTEKNPAKVQQLATTLLGIASDEFVIRYRTEDKIRHLLEVSDHKADAAKATDVAKKVIADKSPALESGAASRLLLIPGLDGTLLEGTTTFPSPEEKRRAHAMAELEEPMKKSQQLIDSYMLGDEASKKMRLAYAQAILASKIDRIHSEWLEVKRTQGRSTANQMDLSKFDAYLKDAQILAERLQELEKAEHAEE